MATALVQHEAQVEWSPFHELTEAEVRRYVPKAAGAYLLWVKLTDGKWGCFYAGQAMDLEGRLLEHLAASEPNACVRRHVREFVCGAEYAKVPTQRERDGIEKFLYEYYRPECNQQDPGVAPIPVNLPS